MKFDKLVNYDWKLFHYILEFNVPPNRTISITDSKKNPLMIFLKKNEDLTYTVRIYKSTEQTTYLPRFDDNLINYTESKEYYTFLFINFEAAHEFVDSLYYHHPEFYPRPNSSDL